MNLFKSIQLIVLASIAMTAAVPTVVVAVPRKPVRMQPSAAKNKEKTTKKSLWKRITDDWEYVALGGCALIGIAALLWTLNNNASGVKPKPNPFGNLNPNDPDLQVGEGDCAICLDPTKELTPCCKQPIHRKCWMIPVKGGDQYDPETGRLLENGKVLKKQTCPICRKDKTR